MFLIEKVNRCLLSGRQCSLVTACDLITPGVCSWLGSSLPFFQSILFDLKKKKAFSFFFYFFFCLFLLFFLETIPSTRKNHATKHFKQTISWWQQFICRRIFKPTYWIYSLFWHWSIQYCLIWWRFQGCFLCISQLAVWRYWIRSM